MSHRALSWDPTSPGGLGVQTEVRLSESQDTSPWPLDFCFGSCPRPHPDLREPGLGGGKQGKGQAGSLPSSPRTSSYGNNNLKSRETRWFAPKVLLRT